MLISKGKLRKRAGNVLGDLHSKPSHDTFAGIQDIQGWSRTPRRRQIDIKREKAKKLAREELGIRAVAFSMRTFSCAKSDMAAHRVARIRAEVAQLPERSYTPE